MILLDWTRMGRSYCLAGVVRGGSGWLVVRPLLYKNPDAPVRNVGWSAYQLDGHQRWEVFDLVLVRPQPVTPEAPHLEDWWVSGLTSYRCRVATDQRRAILEASVAPAGEPLFGEPLLTTWAGAYLMPGTGRRSLTTVIVPGNRLIFRPAPQREGAAEAGLCVELPLRGLGPRRLMVKDHHLLRRAEEAATDPQGQAQALTEAVRQMGEQVAVRLGLARPWKPPDGDGPARCWLMADGFFSLADPQS
jgi:hypothetical protein